MDVKVIMPYNSEKVWGICPIGSIPSLLYSLQNVKTILEPMRSQLS